jgi:hypothetical protein
MTQAVNQARASGPVHQEKRVNKLAVIVLFVGLAACSKKKPEEGREPAQTVAPGAVVGSAAPGVPAPAPAAGDTPSGSAAPGTAGAPASAGAASPSVGCATTTTMVCGADQSDGCAGGLTTVHVCVARDTKAGGPCAQPPAAACPAGQVDACLHDPPQSNNHVCVIAPKP